ncbi:MAG: hypothetical protein GKR77_01535 [Legionellales bacterium]|nr:hypothetical protein [Legionellales bacterium]
MSKRLPFPQEKFLLTELLLDADDFDEEVKHLTTTVLQKDPKLLAPFVAALLDLNQFQAFEKLVSHIHKLEKIARNRMLERLTRQLIKKEDVTEKTSHTIEDDIKNSANKEDVTEETSRTIEDGIKNLVNKEFDHNFLDRFRKLTSYPLLQLFAFTLVNISQNQERKPLIYRGEQGIYFIDSAINQFAVNSWRDLTKTRTIPNNGSKSELRSLIFLFHRVNNLEQFMDPVRTALANGPIKFVEDLHQLTLQTLPMHNLFTPQLVIEWTLARIHKQPSEKKIEDPDAKEAKVETCSTSLEDNYTQAQAEKKTGDWQHLSNPIATYMRLECAIEGYKKENPQDLSTLATLLEQHFGITDTTTAKEAATKIAGLHDTKRSLTLYMIAELAHATDSAAIKQLTSARNPKFDAISQRRNPIYDKLRSILMSLAIFNWLFRSRSPQPLLNSINEVVHTPLTGSTTRKIFSTLANKREVTIEISQQPPPSP